MSFTLDEKASYLYDFFMFPKLLYVDPDEIYKLNDILGDEIMNTFIDHQSHIDFVKAAKKDLEPHKDPLLGFYSDEGIGNYDFPMLLFRSYSFLGHKHYEDYLRTMLLDDENTIKQNLIYAILTVEGDHDDAADTEARAEAKRLLHQRDALQKLIRATPTTEKYRWNLMLLIDYPKDYLNVYLTLLKTIEPIFNDYHTAHQAKLDAFKKDTVSPLEAKGAEAFDELTHGIVPSDVLEQDNLLITSFVNPYRFSIMRFGEDRAIVWGLDMKHGFQKIAEFEQNSRKNRAKVFKTLSDETRYEVLRLIAAGITSTKAIATEIGVSSATVTYHINAFLTAKVIKAERSKSARYRIDYDRLESLWHDFMSDVKDPS